MIILPYGDNALLINLDQRIDEVVNAQVISLDEAIRHLPGVTFTIPAYCSLTVGFDRDHTSFTELKEIISTLNLKSGVAEGQRDIYHIPVCYQDQHSPDMEGVMEFTGLTAEEIVAQHTLLPFRVFMIGFVAGFAYLGSLPKTLYCPRKTHPRKLVPEGAVGLAGYQTGIYPTDAPGGWQLIGRTPVPTFRPNKEVPALLKPGDYVQFKSVSVEEYESIEADIKQGTYQTEVTHG
ncbi:MAG: 5-oxoprolinase subunit PxpB [Roseivirga sp.]|nr:5-oxoprolinase subunit PxpB [Roseivirga sp.]